MPRVINWTRMSCGAVIRTVTVTWNREETLARLMAVPTFKHKRMIAKAWKRMK